MKRKTPKLKIKRLPPGPAVGGFQIYSNDPYLAGTSELVFREAEAARGAHLSLTYSKLMNTPERSRRMKAALQARLLRYAQVLKLSGEMALLTE